MATHEDINTLLDSSPEDSPNTSLLPSTEFAKSLKKDSYPLTFTDEDYKATPLNPQQAKTLSSEIKQMNVYLHNIASSFNQATSITDVCHLVRTGMSVLKDRRLLFSQLPMSGPNVPNSPIKQDRTFEPIP